VLKFCALSDSSASTQNAPSPSSVALSRVLKSLNINDVTAFSVTVTLVNVTGASRVVTYNKNELYVFAASCAGIATE
jgi:hypothetical protein